MRGVRRSIIRFLKALQDGGKILLASFIGVMSLVVNFYMVWTSADWSSRPYYELFREVITVTAATAAVLITIVIYSPEVVKVFGETFLAKRHAAGREEGLVEGIKIRDAQLLKFLEENPETTLDQLKDRLRNRDVPHNGRPTGESEQN